MSEHDSLSSHTALTPLISSVYTELLISTVIWARYPTKINIINPYVQNYKQHSFVVLDKIVPASWTAVLPSILGSRVLLNMRKSVFQRGPGAGHAGTADYVLESFVPAGLRTSKESEYLQAICNHQYFH